MVEVENATLTRSRGDSRPPTSRIGSCAPDTGMRANTSRVNGGHRAGNDGETLHLAPRSLEVMWGGASRWTISRSWKLGEFFVNTHFARGYTWALRWTHRVGRHVGWFFAGSRKRIPSSSPGNVSV